MATTYEDSPETDGGLGLAGATDVQMMPPLDAPDPALGSSGEFDTYGYNAPSSQAPSTFDIKSLGLGLAEPAPMRTQSDKEYLQSLPLPQKIGLALQAFGAGVDGRASPVEALLERKRKQDSDNRSEMTNTINIIQKGTEILRKMPPGLQRDAVATELSKAVGEKYAHVFAAAGSEQQDELKSMMGTFADPDVQNQVIKACSGTADFGQCWRKQANDETFMKRAYAIADSKRLPSIVQKIGPFIEQAAKSGVLDAYKGEDGKFDVPFAKLLEINAKAKIFTDEEMDTMRRQQTLLSDFGIKTEDALKAGAAERAKQAEKPGKETFREGQTRQIIDPKGDTVQQEYKDGKWIEIGRRAKEKPEKEPTQAEREREQKIADARAYVEGITKEQMLKMREKELPNGKPNPDYDPDISRMWRIAGQPLPSEVRGKGKAAPKPAADAPAADPAKPAPAAAPAADGQKPPTLSQADRQKVIAEATAAVNSGAPPEAVKKRLKEKFGIEVNFTKAAKK